MEDRGLTREEALQRLEQFGPNELPQKAQQTLLAIEPVSFSTWGTLLGIALILIVVDELHKLMKHRKA